MKSNLDWFDRNITPLTNAYKEFIETFETTSAIPEFFDSKDEKVLTDRERKFLEIFEYKNNRIKIDSSRSEFAHVTERHTEDVGSSQQIDGTHSEESIFKKTLSPNVLMESTIEGYSDSDLANLSTDDLTVLLHLKQEQFKYEVSNDDFGGMTLVDAQIKRLNTIIQNKFNYNNQNFKIMETQKEFDQVQYLKDQLKYLGFGESAELHRDLEAGIKSVDQQFELKTQSDKTLPGNKVDFVLKFSKSDRGGVFLNSYNATLSNNKVESLSHNFIVSRENTFTAKEAVNLLEGRAVKIEFDNPKTGEMEPAFAKLNFDEPKTEKGNFHFQNFYKNYGVDTADIVEKSNLRFDKPEYKDSVIKSLEKGNIVKVKFEINDTVVEGKAVLNPQYKNINLYDMDMNRINTNKPTEGLGHDQKNDKNNVKEQSIKR